jgi:CRP-like cAMP-binding protein
METLNKIPTTETIVPRLARHPFLANMNGHHIDLLARDAKPVQFKSGETIFHANQPANGFYLIESGAIVLEGSVMEHGPVATDVVHGGEPLGWSWLFPPYLWHFTARTLEPTTAIFFDGNILRKHYEEDLTFGHDLFKRISQVMVCRLQSARRKLLEFHAKSRSTCASSDER